MIFSIIGPTGSGKSKLALNLAKKYNGVIINGDAFQIYREMNIGTAKPTKNDFLSVPHYLYDILPPTFELSIYEYQKLLREELKKHCDKNIFIVGGSGLYLKSALFDYEFVENKQNTSNEYQNYSNEELYEMLCKVDSTSADKIHPNNRKRVIRALDIFYSSGLKKSDIEKKQEHKLIFDVVFIGYDIAREELYKRIDQRVDFMVKEGLFDEVNSLTSKYSKDLKSFQAIGYKEIINGDNKSRDEIIEEIKKASRNYAKRQVTFFKNQFVVNWIKNEEDAYKIIEKYI